MPAQLEDAPTADVTALRMLGRASEVGDAVTAGQLRAIANGLEGIREIVSDVLDELRGIPT